MPNEDLAPRVSPGKLLMDHVLADDCTDPDCEIHNLDVAQAERVVTLGDCAFFLAGAYTLYNLILSAFEADPDLDAVEAASMSLAELRDAHNLNHGGPMNV